ncbi:putative Acyl-CoA N-acyltransferase [Vibrio nigripulchritudo SO65]|uniref:GNAT family N-acetyltransferase n=1 Tax=Vibrio nigripulchritudo TaxID=28173 RepID=UPI0003B20ECA|nr:GNAT family N-acetyltransferase [Vibrio nigripulchritudo]CCN37581.1 putative Acyl-CoA N-acyltransferase [Vibrio nigripulchritudo AM115]CCN39557.1 putative Acyl-CoA N-acyltransferase [Vibrio nigripulchritudo FTn2]CCN66817.1 putative Acyl-CoA N-acyltransferase [Vibrio nigripulchritudo POn4]CCN75657.1 putative Acyl-CoA N-acyltransferase [Vibrio nigripulchritudo SO65]
MEIKLVGKAECSELVPIFAELERYYFSDNAASSDELENYLVNQVFSDFSGVRVVAAYKDSQVLGFATFTVMYPAPTLAGQMYMKDLFVSSQSRGSGVGLSIMKYLAKIASDNGCVRLDWTAETTNPSAGKYYRSIGASLIKEKEYYRFEGDELHRFATS